MYVADSENHRIQKFDEDGNFITKWGASGIGDGQFNSPHGVAVSTTGDVYVADSGNDRIQNFGYVGPGYECVVLALWRRWTAAR